MTVLYALSKHSQTSQSTLTWASNLVKQMYAHSIKRLMPWENGWHFNALRASVDQLNDFHIEVMVQEMKQLAPELWEMLDILLLADKKLNQQDDTMDYNDGDTDSATE